MPQLLGSFEVSEQTPPHSVEGGAHDAVHMPPLHTSPSPQAMPHPPQFARSRRRSTHASPQSERPGSHTDVHMPALHA
jgi:hypothetical protein